MSFLVKCRDVSSTVLYESGVKAISKSSRDVKLLCLQRCVRMFGYGATFLILVHFMTSLGITDAQVGVFMTFTLLGDVVISFCLTLITDKVGRRLILIAGSAMMSFSGIVFALSSNYRLLLFASVIGVISPSGNEIGPFKAIEESILTQLTEKEDRSDIFAWYTLFGTAGAALGTFSCGMLIAGLQSGLSWSTVQAYRVVFLLYALLGAVKLGLSLMLSGDVEVGRDVDKSNEAMELENEGLLSDSAVDESTATTLRPIKAAIRGVHTKSTPWTRIVGMIPSISPKSRKVLRKLIFLFAIDSFASGLASPSWLTYFFTTVHGLPSEVLGTLFLVTNILATISNLLALPIARRIGPLKTMIFTHLPSAIFLSLIALPSASKSGTWLAMSFLALRACTQSMDQAPRQAFLGAAVLPEERTAVLGTVNVVKTLAQAAGIGSTGVLAGHQLWVVMFVGAGGLKASYDLLMLWMFVGLGRNSGHLDISVN